MNDPHVTALHYWVEHDDSVDYDHAVPMDYEDDLLAGLLQSGSSYCFPLILSLSKDARSSYQWCDKLTMRGLGQREGWGRLCNCPARWTGMLDAGHQACSFFAKTMDKRKIVRPMALS